MTMRTFSYMMTYEISNINYSNIQEDYLKTKITFLLVPLMDYCGSFETNNPSAPQSFTRLIDMADMSLCGSCSDLSSLSV